MVGGKRHALGRSFFELTVLADLTTKMLVTREETFGPLAPVQWLQGRGGRDRAVNATSTAFAAYFYACDLGRVFRVAEALEYGMVGINTGLIATEVAPFGGVKESGIGREGSRHGMEEFVEMKAMLVAGLSTKLSCDLSALPRQCAVALVEDGMRVGLGTGSTAAHFVALLESGARRPQGHRRADLGGDPCVGRTRGASLRPSTRPRSSI